MTIYAAGRDLMRARNAEWHETYTMPSLWKCYKPSRENHGSYFFDWTTADEVAWKNFYQRLDAADQRLQERSAAASPPAPTPASSTDSTASPTSEELELLQEAGFTRWR